MTLKSALAREDVFGVGADSDAEPGGGEGGEGGVGAVDGTGRAFGGKAEVVFGGGAEAGELGVDRDRLGAGADFGGAGFFAGSCMAVNAGFGAVFEDAFFERLAGRIHFAAEDGAAEVEFGGFAGGDDGRRRLG